MRKTSRIARLRKALLGVLILGVAVLGGLLLFGRAGMGPQDPSPLEGGRSAEEGVTLIGKDFDYTFTEEEKPIFRIRGEGIRADRDETLFLDQVAVTLYDEDGQPFHVESREASFRRVSNEGQLEGDVVLRGPDGLELRTDRLDLLEKGRVLVAPNEVAIRYADSYTVRADRFRVHLPDSLYVMAGDVRVKSLPEAETPVALSAMRVVYEREQRLLRAEGNADLRHGRDRLSAPKISAYLDSEEQAIVFVRALWDVQGQVVGSAEEGGGETLVRFRGKDLAALLSPQEGGELQKLELEAAQGGRAWIEASGQGVTRRLSARRIEGVLARGVLSSAEAFGGVQIDERSREGGEAVSRTATGRRAKAGFDAGGQLNSATLIENVSFSDGKVTAAGERASLDLSGDRAELFGTPVVVVSERGRLRAPRIVYESGSDVVHAFGGVRAVLEKLEETALEGTPLGEGEGPVFVESREARWQQTPSVLLFRGDVRAWRGENVLLAPELRLDQEQDRLTATGGVKTRWIPAPAEGGEGGEESPAATPPTPVEVNARELTYRQGEGVLTYTGSVRVQQTGRLLTCERLDLEMAEDGAKAGEAGRAETLTCEGDVKLVDPKDGRNISGARAVYRLSEKRIQITGDPVTMKDRAGNVVRGRTLLYNMEDGKVEVRGGDAPPAAPAGTAGENE